MSYGRLRVVKRDNCSTGKKILLYLAAVGIALLLGSFLLMALQVDPIKYYQKMFTMGMIGNKIAYKTFANYIKSFVPLLLTSVALSLAFKMRFWNIGGEGQFIMGALAAATVAFQCGPTMPQLVTAVLMCVAAMLAAGIYGALVAMLKVKFGTNETLLTLMLNYIALYLLYYLGETKGEWNFYLNPESDRPIFGSFANLVSFGGISFGKFTLSYTLLWALAICILMHLYLKYTKHGYEIAVVGDSIGTASYAGMKVNRIVLRTVFLSAALIGLAGAFKVGNAGILSTSITDNVGWNGIIVAWLAKLNTGAILLVSALISILKTGSSIASSTYSAIDSSFADMLQGILLFSVLVADFCIRFRLVRERKEDDKA
ncbi:MAG: ABC transporter permease [Angelakisella sp.]|nr:ABC transporter permease [Angelakisella sp.]